MNETDKCPYLCIIGLKHLWPQIPVSLFTKRTYKTYILVHVRAPTHVETVINIIKYAVWISVRISFL